MLCKRDSDLMRGVVKVVAAVRPTAAGIGVLCAFFPRWLFCNLVYYILYTCCVGVVENMMLWEASSP